MKKFVITVAAVLAGFVNVASANYVPGRKNVVVECRQHIVNGYAVNVISTEGTRELTGVVSRGGVAGYMPLKSFDVYRHSNVDDMALAEYRDIATNGADFGLKLNTLRSTPAGEGTYPGVAKVRLGRRLVRISGLVCRYPVHIL